MMNLYPLKFHPRFVEKIWGGRKLQTILQKPIPSNISVGESWELYDFPPGVVEDSKDWVSAVVAEGPLAGKTLHQLVQDCGADLLGSVGTIPSTGQFPILIKFLDAREDLSVQVHPPQEYADTHPGTYLKSEAWYVFQSDPGSRIFKGLTPQTTQEQFAASINAGEVEKHLKSIPVKAGQCFYLPSGTVHALGAGILAAEVQTPSDTTFRVFDFNRIDASTGKPRKLHVEQAMECIDFTHAPEPKQNRSHAAGFFTTVTRLVQCEYFTLEKVRFTEGIEEPVPYDQPVVWMMLQGSAEIRVDGVSHVTRIETGQTVLLPAKMQNPILKTLSDCVWLEVTFPSGS